jgi:hypothetical protein
VQSYPIFPNRHRTIVATCRNRQRSRFGTLQRWSGDGWNAILHGGASERNQRDYEETVKAKHIGATRNGKHT